MWSQGKKKKNTKAVEFVIMFSKNALLNMISYVCKLTAAVNFLVRPSRWKHHQFSILTQCGANARSLLVGQLSSRIFIPSFVHYIFLSRNLSNILSGQFSSWNHTFGYVLQRIKVIFIVVELHTILQSEAGVKNFLLGRQMMARITF